MIESDITLYEEHCNDGKHSDEKVIVFVDRFLRIHPPKVFAYMDDSYNRDYIQILNTDQRIVSFQIQQDTQCSKMKMIHSGFSAAKLDDQNESTNFAGVIPKSFEQGVTL